MKSRDCWASHQVITGKTTTRKRSTRPALRSERHRVRLPIVRRPFDSLGSTGRERIYDGYPDVALDMISSRTFDGRIQLLEYVPTVLSGPPGSAKA